MSKNKNSRKYNKQNKLSKILSKSKNEFETIKNISFKLDSKELERYVPFLSNHIYLKNQINLSTSTHFKNFYDVKLPDLDINENIGWCLGVLKTHKDKISQLMPLEGDLTNKILSDDFIGALKILDEIDCICGLSTWSLSIRGSLFKISGDEDGYSALLKGISNNKSYSDFFKTVCRRILDRFDESSIQLTSADSLKKQIIRGFENDDFASFLIYKITPKDYLSEFKIDYNVVLNYEKKSSIIEIYKALISYVESQVFYNQPLTKELSNLIISLYCISEDPVLYNAVIFYDLKINKVREFSFDYNIFDLYTEGKYNELIDFVKNIEQNYLFSTFQVISKTSARVNANPFGGIKKEIVNHISSLIFKKEDYLSSYYSLLTLCYSFSDIGWFKELQLYVSKESRFIDEKTNLIIEKIIDLNTKETTPEKLKSFSVSYIKSHFELLDFEYINSTTYKFFEALSLDSISDNYEFFIPNQVDKIRYKKYKAISLFNSGEIKKSIEIINEIIQCDSDIDVYEGLKFLVNAYIKIGDAERSIEILVDYYLKNKNSILLFDVSKIAASAKKLMKTSNSINIPICLSIYSRYVGDEYESALRVSIDNFFIFNNLSKPFEILSKDDLFDEEKLNYFLEYVCTPSNMKLTLLFEDKEAISSFRIELCNNLIEKNISKDSLIEETKNITKDQFFKKALAHVDQSRIHVDTNSFKNNRAEYFKEIFDRFCELKKQDYSESEDEKAFENIIDVLSNMDANDYDKFKTIYVLNVTLNEKNKTFHRLIGMLRDEFTFGLKGLNSYLSTRIRHGVLPTDLRKSVQNEALWTAIDQTTGEPKKNTYWISKIDDLDKDDKEKETILESLSIFTKKFEALIEEINDNWLQVWSLDQDINNIKKGGNKNEALFDYSISSLETYVMQKKSYNYSYEDLIDEVLNWLWYRTDKNLEKVRSKIEVDAAYDFNALFDELEKSLYFSNSNQNFDLLSNSIRKAKEGLNNSLKSISSWFNRSKKDKIDSFYINTAIDIASQSTNVKVINSSPLNLKIDGKFLSSFVDIFYIIFENALSKSKLQREDLIIELELSSENDSLVINVVNNCLDIDMDKKEEELEYYRNAYGDEDLMRVASQKEGGSGLFKIWNIINKHIDIEHVNEFGYFDSDKFRIKIILKDALKVINYENSNC